MNPIELLKNLYFGDRWCEKIVINNKDRTLELHVDRISRLRPGTEQWDYYTEEDIPHGIVLFTGVKEIIFNPSGMVPNDEIYDVYAKWVDEENKYMFFY
ncbi:DUF6258 family protein [Bacillus sp. FJAT-27245]|uniref:DUF6258 family protein n=1 Tax=Bacillus sp. FJAT-27245 TaxID=1684144 RepID=UPI0006A76FB0|nr:DUF6258 family protein [Bacillus sp. FJAT-27245]